jgi:hypothetical protein
MSTPINSGFSCRLCAWLSSRLAVRRRHGRRAHLAALLAAAAVAPSGWSQAPAPSATTQKVSGPQARYWLSAETASGFSMAANQSGGVSGVMGAMLGGGPSAAARKSLRLELGSLREGQPPEASHAVPPALQVGASLPLLGPERAPPEPPERDLPQWEERGERPQGRLLFFWGCGDSAGPGQPVVLDLARLADSGAGTLPVEFRQAYVRLVRSGPSPGRDRGYAEWPHRRDSTAVPAAASLVGAHQVRSAWSPEIRFQVDPAHDFMEALRLTQARQTSGAQQLSWNRVPTALGYFATAMGVKEGSGRPAQQDLVFWNSSAQRLLGGEALMGFLPPAETERLVRERVVLAADTTRCLVPREAVAAAGGALVLVNLNAFGPELNVVHPPRPADLRVEWKQEYAVKLRLRAHTGSIAGMEGRRSAGLALGRPGQ